MIHNYYNTKHMCFVGHVGGVGTRCVQGVSPRNVYKYEYYDASGYIRVYEQIRYIVNVTANSKTT